MIQIIQGDSLEVLKSLDTESIDMCITSPPYWGLRDYGIANQIGIEINYKEYISKLIDVFGEVSRVLKKTGTCWVNISDSYVGATSQHKSNGSFSKKSCISKKTQKSVQGFGRKLRNQGLYAQGLQMKSLVGIPERFVIAMAEAGWIRRNTIIWYKSNCMPSSVKDRFTVDFEYLYFFSKNKKYYFNQQFDNLSKGGKRNKRAVWPIPVTPSKGVHIAAYPESLVKVPIMSACPVGGVVLDVFMGSGTTLKVANDLGMNGIGIELNSEYIDIAKKRIGFISKDEDYYDY